MATEFGGSPQRNGIQPPVDPNGRPGHAPTPAERQRLLYQTGQDEDSTRDPQPGREAFNGLLPADEQRLVAPDPEKFEA